MLLASDPGALQTLNTLQVSSKPVAVVLAKSGLSGQDMTSHAIAVSADSLSLSLAAGALSCALGSYLAASWGIPGFSLGLVAVLASGFASIAASVAKRGGSEDSLTPFQGATVIPIKSALKYLSFRHFVIVADQDLGYPVIYKKINFC